MITTNEFLNALAIEIKSFMANHHNDDLVPMSNILRVSGRPALDDIAGNIYPKTAVLIYWLTDDWNKSNIGESKPKSSFGITIIASDYKNKKRDEVAYELKDRLQAFLIGETPIAGASFFEDVRADGGPVKFHDGTMINLVEVQFKTNLYMGQSGLYAIEPSNIDIHGEDARWLK